jgi:hypothetical protein
MRPFPVWVKVVVAASVGAILVALPLGFVDEAFAIAAGVAGLYFVLPMLVALVLVPVAERRPRAPVRILVALVVPLWFLWVTYWGRQLGPVGWGLALLSFAVVAFAGARLWRTSTSGSAASAPARGGSGSGGGGG